MSAPSEDPKESVVSREGTSDQRELATASASAGSSYPPPPPGAGVELRGTVRVSDAPLPGSDGAVEVEIDEEEASTSPTVDGSEVEIDVSEVQIQGEPEPEPAAAEPATAEEAAAEPAAAEPAESEAQAEAAPEPAEDLEIEEVEEEDPDALDLQEVDASADEAEPHNPPPVPGEGAAPAAAAAEPAKEIPPDVPKRKRKRPWFETFFNDDYLRTVPPPTEKEVARQVDFLEGQLGLERGATILDVGCGLGMHAVELATRGYLVVGLDLSLPMLSRAGDEAQERGLKINFLHGDMREMAFDGAFDAVLCWGTTFGYFDDDTNRKVIERLFKSLKPRGLLLLDVVNRDFVMPKQPNLIWFEGDGCVCMEETSFNYITSRLEVKRTVILDDGRQRETRYTIRLYSVHELGQLLHQKGFRVAQISGEESTPTVFFGTSSPRMIILAERRVHGSEALSGEMAIPIDPDVSAPPPPPPRPSEPAGSNGGDGSGDDGDVQG